MKLREKSPERRSRSVGGQATEKKGMSGRLRNAFCQRAGTTLVEMIVTLALIMLLFGMAASSLASAARVFVKVQRQQYAQSILDTLMTELQSMTRDATQYVKIYASGEDVTIAGQTGGKSGTALEFVSTEGYAVLISTEGCSATDLYIGGTRTGETDAVSAGRLFTRYYLRTDGDKYSCEEGDIPVARELTEAYPDKFYMGNYVRVTFSYPTGEGEINGDEVSGVKAEIALYRDADCTDKVTSESEYLDFRYKLVRKDSETAQKTSATTEPTTAQP